MQGFSRRNMLQNAVGGFGYLALAGLCGRTQQAQAEVASPLGSTPTLEEKPTHFFGQAKRVIFLCMSGGPSQVDTFDYKPQTGKKPHPGSIFDFSQHGESGLWISELFPKLAKHADKLCILNGMYADSTNHAQSFLQMHTGERLRPRPCMGSWVAYGLGSENQNLPGFISLCPAKPAAYSSVFLPPIYEGTPIGVNGENMSTATITNISGGRLPLGLKRRQMDLVQAMNREHLAARPQDPALEAVIESMELGFRMQATAPDLLDISKETAGTLERYEVGKNQGFGGTVRDTDFGRQCLLARRFAEAGVRFIELTHSSWDQHKNHRADLKANCKATDGPIAALLDDLAQRGLLEETLVVWGGEFGRPALVPRKNNDSSGHNSRGFTYWMAGGGIKGGHVHGKTDVTGVNAVEGKVHFRDLHATMLHQLGLNSERLVYSRAGREFRLTGLEGGRVVKEVLA